MKTILVTTYYHYGIDKKTYEVDNALEWIKREYPDAEELDCYTYKDYDTDTTIEIL